MNLLRSRAGRWWFLAWLGLLPALSGQADDTLPEATNLWTLPLGHLACNSSPALAPDGTIYQGTFDGLLLAISPTGKTRWKFSTGTEGEIKSSPAVADDGTIYFGARDRKCYAVTPSGRLKWVFPTGAWVDSSPGIAADGTVYFGGWDKSFYALDPAGTLKWSYPVGAIVVSSPSIATDGTVYFGAFDHYLYALTPAGKLKWRFAGQAEICSSPAIGPDGTVYFTAVDGYLYALQPDGTQQWRFHCGNNTEASPILDEQGNVYVPGTGKAGAIGEYVVTREGVGHLAGGLSCPVDGSAVAVTGRVYWSRPWRTFQAYQPDGTVFWRADLLANLSSSPVVGMEGTVYFTSERFFYAVQPVGPGLPLAKSSWPMFRANPRHTGRVGSP